MFGAYSFNNNVRTTLNASILAAGTSFVLVGAAAPLNNPPISVTPAIFTLVDNLAAPTKIEIVVSTSVSAGGGGTINVASLLRGQEGTTAQDWPAGTIVVQSVTKAMLNPASVNINTLLVEAGLTVGDGFSATGNIFLNGAVYLEGGANGYLHSTGSLIEGPLQVDSALTAANGLLSTKTAPVNSSATGTTKEIRFDSNYIYVCVGTNNWKRVALSAF